MIVDVCTAHGTWFDKDELRRIVEFIRAGGLEAARADEIAELERKRREFIAAQLAGPAYDEPSNLAPSALLRFGQRHRLRRRESDHFIFFD